MDRIIETLARELGKDPRHVENVVRLLDEGSTVPFIARYRKELHGAMDDTALRTLEERLSYLRGLAERREAVKKAIEAQGKLTEELAAAIDAAGTLAEVEDLYRPYKQKRRTRATIAREKGLAPLAEVLFAQGADCPVPEEEAGKYLDPEKGVETVEDALAGASDIIAETVSDDAALRGKLRALLGRSGYLTSSAVSEEDSVYRLYYDFRQPLSRVQGYQVLAINRGEKEGFLKVSIDLDREAALPVVRRHVLIPGSRSMAFVRGAAEDAYDRLLFPSLEREARGQLSDDAYEGAIGQFALNLRPLLMQPPVKGKVTMGLDPGYRMGCKVAVVDGTGKVLDTAVVYPTYGARQEQEAIAALAGCSVATAVKAVWELSEAGYLTVKHTKYHSGKLGRTVYGKNTYTVDLALLKKGYTILDRAVLEQELTDSALIVLCAIIVCAGNSSRAFPSISALQKKTGAARSTVCAGLRLLKALKTLLVQLCIKKNQEHSRNSYHICGVAEGNYAAASCDQHIAASDACQAPIEGFSLMGVVRFLANKVKTQITGVLNYLLKERSYRLT